MLGLAGIVLLVMWVIRAVLPEKRRWWQPAIPLLIAVAAFGIDLIIQTDPERIKAVIYAASKAIEKENPNAMELLLSENYHDSRHKTKRDLMGYCRAILSEPLVEKNITRIASLEISPDKLTAVAVVNIRILFDKRSFVYHDYKQLMFLKMKVNLLKENNKWLIGQAELLEVDMQHISWQDITQIPY